MPTICAANVVRLIDAMMEAENVLMKHRFAPGSDYMEFAQPIGKLRAHREYLMSLTAQDIEVDS